ncbi:phage major capsid protein [Streptomyces sp. PSKA54]|uniref:Phage major capsid protein n=1 Tax=Streptomyces himalayensis subsp. aureolus TaxID=2758039 RepID=A0A7W2D715_9ACTN|nr:phage major capsid protein [Streptomyces himalayensis]MBA4865917.1 phage major capsid protein [Streptomyces himalayensis subsp. aureolus]
MAPTLTVPRNSDELAEMLADPAKRKEIFASQDSTQEFMDAYAQRQQGEGTELNRLVAEETQRQLANMLRENEVTNTEQIKRLNLDPQNRGSRANMLTSHRQGTAHNSAAPGAAVDQYFASGIEYVRNIWHKNPSADAAKLDALRNAASSVSPADGGFLVPETLRSQLMEIALEKATVRPLATVVPMESARVPLPMIDSTTNQGSVFGGMVAYWGEEGAALTDSSPKFGRITLDAKKLTGLSAVPNELLQDSITSFSALLERLWPQALAFEEDAKFTAGSGVGEPLGFRGAGNPAAVAVTRTTASQIKYDDIVNMYARMLPSSLSSAVWTCSPDALPQLLKMSLTVGTGGNSVFVVNAAGPHPMSIFGRPLIITEKGGTLGARGDIAFSDLSYYLVGDRQTMTADSSTDYQFGSDKTTFRIIQRVDGQPWLKSAITPQNGSSNTLSPFVELAA